MKTASPQKVHFIGIGGAGVAPLAELALGNGISVSGSDCEPNAKSAALAAHGARIFAGHATGNLDPDTDLVVYSSAVPSDNPERRRAAVLGIPEMRRGEYLGLFLRRYRRVVAVSGSHGKSSITTAIAAILRAAGLEPGYLIGAEVGGGLGSCAPGRGNDIFVTEVDESDGTHTLVTPFLGVVPNVETDHSWSVGGVAALCENFRRFGEKCSELIYYSGEISDRLFADHPAARRIALPPPDFRFAGRAGFQAQNLRLAVEAVRRFGIEESAAQELAAQVPGVARRMTTRFVADGLEVVEDYAHHPTEVAAALRLLRLNYPGRHLRVVIQPHRFARLEAFFDDFVSVLRKADSVIVARVFAAWSESGCVDGAALAAACGGEYLGDDWETIARRLLATPRPGVAAVLGAGDLDHIFPFLPQPERN